MRLIIALIAFGLLSACGGGVGDGPSDFTGFSNLPQTGTVRMTGHIAMRDLLVGSDSTLAMGSVTTSDDAVADLVFETGRLTGIRVTGGSAVVSFDNTDTLLTAGGFLTFDDTSSDDFLVVRDPAGAIHEYASYGVGLDATGGADGRLFAVALGQLAPTMFPSSMTPATYSGGTTGIYIDGTGSAYLTTSTFTASTSDFATISYDSTGTQRASLSGGAADTDSTLDFSGSATINAGAFSGTPGTIGFTGTVDGQFYGPDADELAGTFSLDVNGGGYLGAFGTTQ